MTENNLITISQACEKYDLNRNTLLSWVRTKKVESSKSMVGQKAVHHLDEESLKQLLAKKLMPADGVLPEAPPSVVEAPPSPPKTGSEEGSHVVGTDPPGSMKQRKLERNDAKRRKQNHVQNVKNSMRGFSIEELSRINAWIGCRMLEQLKAIGNSTPTRSKP